VIEMIAVDATEQWRRLHARNVDVVPASPASSLAAYAGMTSVRILEYPVTGSVGLSFNVRNPVLADAAIRRELVANIDARAAAAAGCGDPNCVSQKSPRLERAGVALPASLGLLVLASDSIAVDIARVVRLQLEAAGVHIDLQLVDIAQLSERLTSASFDVMVGPLPNGPNVLHFVRRDAALNLTGWSNDALEEAMARQDLDTAMQIVATELPVVHLVDDRQFAAVDAEFCGGRPTDVSWRWLADVYPCEQRE
jgi:ABC-type oligopeptide transport system substrate-binding subunit